MPSKWIQNQVHLLQLKINLTAVHQNLTRKWQVWLFLCFIYLFMY